jgi:hypothetical protein
MLATEVTNVCEILIYVMYRYYEQFIERLVFCVWGGKGGGFEKLRLIFMYSKAYTEPELNASDSFYCYPNED